MTTTFTVTAQRGQRRWILQCVEHPGALSEVARLSEAETAIREAIAYVADLPADSFSITVVPSIDARARGHIEAATRLRTQASQAQKQASDEIVQAALTLAESGLTLRDIGTILGLSHQRVHQLLTANAPERAARWQSPDPPSQ